MIRPAGRQSPARALRPSSTVFQDDSKPEAGRPIAGGHIPAILEQYKQTIAGLTNPAGNTEQAREAGASASSVLALVLYGFQILHERMNPGFHIPGVV